MILIYQKVKRKCKKSMKLFKSLFKDNLKKFLKQNIKILKNNIINIRKSYKTKRKVKIKL